MITINNLTSHELIGLNTKIAQSTNSHLVGLSGKIIDETKNMFAIKTNLGVKNIPKDINTWRFLIDGQVAEINGKKLTKRSFERLGRKI